MHSPSSADTSCPTTCQGVLRHCAICVDCASTQVMYSNDTERDKEQIRLQHVRSYPLLEALQRLVFISLMLMLQLSFEVVESRLGVTVARRQNVVGLCWAASAISSAWWWRWAKQRRLCLCAFVRPVSRTQLTIDTHNTDIEKLTDNSCTSRLHHWSSAAPDCLPSVTELFRSPLLVSGTVCLNMSLLHLLWLSSGLVSRHICLTYHIPTQCDCTVPVQWRLLLSDTIIVLVTYLLTTNCFMIAEFIGIFAHF